MLEPVFSRRLFYIFVLVFLGLSLPLKSFAQVDAGSVSGTVRDTSGAVIGGASVRLTNEATGCR
jgi:hypothetical protein